MSRSVNEDRLIRKIGEFTVLDEAAEKAIRDYLKRQPKSPPLVSRGGAAEILEVRPGHLDRIEGMPETIEIEGGWNIYLKSDIVELKAKIDADKAAVNA